MRLFKVRFCLPLCLLMLLSHGLLRAQSVDTAGLEVDVRDPSGAHLPGATLTLTQTTTHNIRTGVTDSHGRYRFAEVPVGAYDLDVAHSGFAETQHQGIHLSVGQSAQLQVTLSLASANQVVQVNSDVSEVDPDRTTIGQTIDSEEIQNLPSDGRNFLDFAVTVPEVTVTETTGQNSGFSVNGQRSRSNSIMIDGVENNGQLNGNVRQTLSQDAIAQFQVLTNQFPAEFGGAGGGFINVVTKSGSDNFHGSAYYFERNDWLNTPNPFASANPGNYSRNDMGVSIGGPIKPNRTYFFGALEYTGLHTSSVSATALRGIPSSCDGETPHDAAGAIMTNNAAKITCHLRNGHPFLGSDIQTVGSTGYIPRSSAQMLSSMRIDHRINNRNTLVARVLYVQYIQGISTNAGGVYDYTTSTGTYTRTQNYFTEWTHIFSPTLINEAHFMVAPQRLKQLPHSSGPGADEGGSVIFGPTADFPVTLNEDHYEADDALTWTHGNHLIKGGMQLNYIRAYSYFPSYFAGEWNFSTINNFLINTPNEYRQAFGTPDIHLPDTLLGFYLEDSWRIASRVTLNYGVRYDLDLEPQGYNLNAANPIMTPLAKGIPRDYNNFAPRIGLAWSLDSKGKTVLRAGYGMFYDKNILILARNTLLAQERLVLNTTTARTPVQQYAVGPYTDNTTYPTGYGTPPSYNTIDSQLVIPMIHQADLGIDRAITSRITLSITGVHVEGEKLLKAANNNLAPPVILTASNAAALCNCTTSFQMFGRPYFGTRVNSGYTDIYSVGPWGHSNYNGLRATFVAHSWHGLTTRAGFVWSRAEDDAPDFLNGAYPDDPYNPHAEKSLSNEDVRNRFTGSLYYRIPFRASRRHFDWTRALLGNWIFSGTMIAGSGTPENITVGSDVNNDDETTDRPFVNGVIVGRNTFRGARNSTLSLRGQKEFRLFHGSRLTFSGEAFNALNHENISDYLTTWGTSQVASTSFGKANAAGGSRVFQLGVRYSW